MMIRKKKHTQNTSRRQKGEDKRDKKNKWHMNHILELEAEQVFQRINTLESIARAYNSKS